ncbi:hypothetical protein HMPREF0063_11592 [Aeromicrobium marinum DSM 15272]|uniref:Uncharacterized protein n=1 Tax=Aeromicrobium marinum DSM 15272 TaxID=585531 RepID=E2SC33_9ACTN|nr:hypothetical protein HMPREF0063_11592 [Aeromicrobium marinum DSM 15272]
MSPAVYRRRRIALALALAVVVAVVWLVAGLVGNDDESPAPVATPTPSTAAPEPDPVEPAPGVSEVSLASSGDGCDPRTVRITPTVPAGQQAGGDIRVDLAVSTSSETPCTLTAEDAELLVIISSGGRPVYDSTVCTSSLIAQPVPLTPRWVTSTAVTWTGRAGCVGAEPFVGAGEYTIQLGTLGGEPGSATFGLAEPPPPPEPEPAPEPEPPVEEPPAEPPPAG